MINVVGLGYIGLPTALMLAVSGTQVVGTDIDEDLLEKLKNGIFCGAEKGMQELLSEALDVGMSFSDICVKADTYIVCVPTPYVETTKKIDTTLVCAAVSEVLKVCGDGATLIIESTVAPGTIKKVIAPMTEPKGIKLAYCPERVLPGALLREFVENARIVGADTVEVAERVRDVYKSFVKGNIEITDIKTAETVKVAENTYRAVNIALANELALISRDEGMDVNEVIRLANMHPRVNILNPGPGVGGHCIPIDPWFLIEGRDKEDSVIRSALLVNDAMADYVMNRIAKISRHEGIKSPCRVGLYGISYKENVDDIRNSPTLKLLEKTSEFAIYDPFVKKKVGNNQFFELQAFLDAVSFVVIMCGHDEIKKNQELLRGKIVLDTRNVCDSLEVYKL